MYILPQLNIEKNLNNPIEEMTSPISASLEAGIAAL